MQGAFSIRYSRISRSANALLVEGVTYSRRRDSRRDCQSGHIGMGCNEGACGTQTR
jgi:hypothetical protein